jgi:hypothetical protein
MITSKIIPQHKPPNTPYGVNDIGIIYYYCDFEVITIGFDNGVFVPTVDDDKKKGT